MRDALGPVIDKAWGHRFIGPALRSALALVGTVVALRLAFHRNPPTAGIIVYGLVLGLLYAFIAFGLILVYRATRIINFAQAEIGAACGVLGVLLMQKSHLPYLLALVISVVAGLGCGVAVEFIVVRRFRSAPRLVLSVATIGVALLFAAIQLLLPDLFGAGAHGQIDVSTGLKTIANQSRPILSPFSSFRFHVGPQSFDGNSIVVFVAAVVLMAGLLAFFKFTDVGLAVRASAENRDRAVLLGLNVTRVSSVAWMLAGGLSAVGLFLRIPVVGVPVGVFIGPSILLYALAAAVIARMESFGTAFLASIALGVTEQAIYFSTHDPNVPVVVTLPVLLAAMLVQRNALSRGQDSGVATWRLSRDHRFIPVEMRSLTEVRAGTTGLGLALAAAAVFLPDWLGPTQRILISVVVCYAIVAVSLVVLTGWSGQISLGQWGFAGVGAAVAGGMATHLNADIFVTLAVAGVAGAAMALLIGIPALRIQGLFLAVTTLAFAQVVQNWVLSTRYFGWLLPPATSLVGRPLLFARFSIDSPISYYRFSLVFLVLALLSARSLRRSRAGRILIAVRDNPKGAEAFAVSVRRARLWAFAISGFWAAIAGALFVYQEGAIDPISFSPDLSLQLLVIAVIGGITSLPGAILGATFFGFVEYGGLSQSLQLLASGFGALVLLWVLPGGLAQPYYGLRDVVLRLLAHRHQIDVPTLIADGAPVEKPTSPARVEPVPA